MITRRRLFASLACACSCVTWAVLVAAQSQPPSTRAQTKAAPANGSSVLLQVTGGAPESLAISPEEFAKLRHRSVRAKAHDGGESEYSGVALVDVLAKAGVPTGKELRGPAMSLYVVVEAADSYRAVFALAELDPGFTDRVIMLADRRDGRPLTAHEGPLQVIVPGEKKHARWVRQAVRLKVGRG